jgi:hypothetical protein
MFADTNRQLRKLSIYKPMQFQVTQIEFDFDDAQEYIPEEDKQEVYNDVIGAVWEAVDEDDLIEEITSATGWCINSIDYRYILN